MKGLMDKFLECRMDLVESTCFHNQTNEMLNHNPKGMTGCSLTETARNLVLMKN